MRACGYLRTAVSDPDGVAMEDQRRQVEELAAEQGFPVQRWFVDEGVAGHVPASKRPAWSDLLAEVKDGTYQVVAVLRLDRLGRSRKIVDAAVQDVCDAGGHVRVLTT